MPAKGRGRHPLRSTWLGRGRGRGRGLTSPVGKQILPSGAARVGHEVYSDWFFPETELKLYLRNTTTNGISIGGVACYDLLTTAGASADTAVVNTTAGGTEIQLTKTAGGSVAAFISGRVPVGGWTITASDVALWLQESVATVNAGLRFRLFKYSGGTETEIGGSPFNRNAEFNTASSLETLAGNVTDTALAEDDRLLLRVYAVNIGTMGAGTATLSFNGATGGTTGQITVYPDAANGNPRFAFGTSTSWAACRSNATSDPVEYPSNEVVFQGELATTTYIISRVGYVFNTSSIPDDATITSASFFAYSTTTGDGSETDPTKQANGALVAYTPSSDTAPTTSDYQQFGTIRLADTDVTRANFVASSAYKEWALNATGLAAISKTGNTRLGIRPSNDFSDATAPTARSYAVGYYAAQAGTANDPMLVVNYSTYSFADSYINVYPSVAFKAENSGATISGIAVDTESVSGSLGALASVHASVFDREFSSGLIGNVTALSGAAHDYEFVSCSVSAAVSATLNGAVYDAGFDNANINALSSISGMVRDIEGVSELLNANISLSASVTDYESANGSLSTLSGVTGSVFDDGFVSGSIAGVQTATLSGGTFDYENVTGSVQSFVSVIGSVFDREFVSGSISPALSTITISGLVVDDEFVTNVSQSEEPPIIGGGFRQAVVRLPTRKKRVIREYDEPELSEQDTEIRELLIIAQEKSRKTAKSLKAERKLKLPVLEVPKTSAQVKQPIVIINEIVEQESIPDDEIELMLAMMMEMM